MTALTTKTIEISVLSVGMTPTRVTELVEVPEELEIATKRKSNQGMFRFLTIKSGDDRVVWDKTSLREIQAAEKMFFDMIKKGLKPFKVGLDGKATSEVMTEFDAEVEEIIFLPMQMVQGG